MSSSDIFITPSTSLVLIKRADRPTNIYLSTFRTVDFKVSIRDTTGSSNLQVNISTIGGARFIDNSIYYLLDQPYGFLNLSLRTSTLWQPLHTSGQEPEKAAANIGTTNISSSYFSILSSATKNVSTMILENLQTFNPLLINAPFVIGNLSTPGFILIQSTMNVYGDALFRKNVSVGQETIFLSSFFVESILPLSSAIQAFSSVGVGREIYVGSTVTIFSTLFTRSSIAIQTLQVQASTSQTAFEVLNDIKTAGTISTFKGFDIEDTLYVANFFEIFQNVSSMGGNLSANTLRVERLNAIGNLSILSSASIFSTLALQSSLSIRDSLSTFSTSAIGRNLSTALFQTPSLSTFGSVSTSGSAIINQEIQARGFLSANSIFVTNLFSTGASLFVSANVSTLATASLSSLTVNNSGLFSTLFISSSVGVGNSVTVQKNLSATSLFLSNTLNLNEFRNLGQTIVASNIGVRDTIVVENNMTVQQSTVIVGYDVASYQVSTLIIKAAEPTIGLRASTLIASNVTYTNKTQLSYDPSESYNISTNAYGAVLADKMYINRFRSYYLSTQTAYTETILNTNVNTPGLVEILQPSLFPRGLSTLNINASTITAENIIGSFIGNASLLPNIPVLYSTLSTNYLTASTILTKVFSTSELVSYNANTYNFTSIDESLSFATPAFFLSTGIPLDTIDKFQYIQSLNSSTLNITNTLFLNAGNRRVGVMTSTPRYNLDISGSLYYTGILNVSSQNTVSFSTQKPVVSFSTLYFSSIAVRDTLGFNSLAVNSSEPLSLPNAVYIANRQPTKNFYSTSFTGVYTNSTLSSIDFNLAVITYNNTKNVAINNIDINPTNFDLSILPLEAPCDLFVNGDMKASTIHISSLSVQRKLIASTIEMSSLKINAGFSTFYNTISTNANTNTSIVNVNGFVEFYKNSTLQGSLHIKKPSSASYNQSFFCVYNEAYISSMFVNSLHVRNILLGTQDL
jgi:hypothetical protein